MPAIGIGLLWLAYWTGLSGYSLIRGYCNSPGALANPFTIATWTTTLYTGTGVLPSAGECGSAPAGPKAPAGTNLTNANPQGGAELAGNPQPGVQGVTAGGHGR